MIAKPSPVARLLHVERALIVPLSDQCHRYNRLMRPTSAQLVLWCLFSCGLAQAAAQQPQPARPRDATAPPAAALPGPGSENTPTEQQLGVPIFPGSQFIRSYDAGQGQRYYLFGTSSSAEEVVAYYRTALRQRGEVVFERPATYMFEVGRYRPETMAFPPGVTVKDFTWAGSAGYPNPVPRAQPDRFPTVVQIVPAPL
jgi:hypothetical protein